MKAKAPRKKMTKENWTGLAFITPALVLLFIFLFIPFFMTIGYSFTNYNILKTDKMEFVGLKNFIRLTQDTVFLKRCVELLLKKIKGEEIETLTILPVKLEEGDTTR